MKTILVLARNDVNEAARVAAGLTIFGHHIDLVLMSDTHTHTITEENKEILELADITPIATSTSEHTQFNSVVPQELFERISAADAVLNF